MKEELERILTNLHDAGCGSGEVEKAKQLDGGSKNAIPFDKLESFFNHYLQ